MKNTFISCQELYVSKGQSIKGLHQRFWDDGVGLRPDYGSSYMGLFVW